MAAPRAVSDRISESPQIEVSSVVSPFGVSVNTQGAKGKREHEAFPAEASDGTTVPPLGAGKNRFESQTAEAL